MNLKIYDEPWPHAVIDNFFDIDTFSYLKKHIEDMTYWQERCSYVKPVINQTTKESGSSITFCDINDTKIGSFLENKWEEIDLFNSLVQSDREHNKLKHVWEVKFTTGPGTLDIHIEHPDKVATMTIYMYPLHDNGTFYFDSNKNFYKAVAWKPNRACVMSNRDNYWHAYAGYEDHTRITINSFLVRN
jgi:hypothetical protein